MHCTLSRVHQQDSVGALLPQRVWFAWALSAKRHLRHRSVPVTAPWFPFRDFSRLFPRFSSAAHVWADQVWVLLLVQLGSYFPVPAQVVALLPSFATWSF